MRLSWPQLGVVLEASRGHWKKLDRRRRWSARVAGIPGGAAAQVCQVSGHMSLGDAPGKRPGRVVLYTSPRAAWTHGNKSAALCSVRD